MTYAEQETELQAELSRVRSESVPRVVILKQFFTLDDIGDGEIDYQDMDWEIVDCEPDVDSEDSRVSLALAALEDEGLAQPSSSYPGLGDWLNHPDGSYTCNYYKGLRCEPSGFLYGFSDSETIEILDRARELF